MLTGPFTTFGGELAWICVEPDVLTFVASCAPNLTCGDALKFWPMMVTAVPPAAGPSDGCTMGAAASVGAEPDRVAGLAASTKLTPRFERLKTSCVSSTSSISDETP